jgi:hypothetical protein
LGWVLAQVAEFAFETFGAPDWVLKSLVIALVLGLPLVVFLAWAFELTPEGIKRDAEVDHRQPAIAQKGHKLDRAIIVLLLVALAWFAWDRISPEMDDDSAATAAAETRAALEQGDAGLPADMHKPVAVLPFIAMSSGPDDEYFADGLTEEILNSLAALPELLVTARTSAFSFKGKDVPVQEIAAVLQVEHIVEVTCGRKPTIAIPVTPSGYKATSPKKSHWPWTLSWTTIAVRKWRSRRFATRRLSSHFRKLGSCLLSHMVSYRSCRRWKKQMRISIGQSNWSRISITLMLRAMITTPTR